MSNQRESAINIDEALLFTAGDRDMLISMGELFLEEGPKQLAEVNAQIESGDAKGIRNAAHTLKGSVTIFGASQAAAAALAIEKTASSGDLSGICEDQNELNHQLQRLLHEIERLCHD